MKNTFIKSGKRNCRIGLAMLSTLLSLPFHSLAQDTLPPLKIDHLAGNVYTYVNYGSFEGQLYPTNAMYLVTSEGVVLFDTPWDSAYFQPLLDSIWKRHHQKVIMCFSTHFHTDRTAGLAYFASKSIETFTTRQTDSLCAKNGENRAKNLIPRDTLFHIGGTSFQLWYPGPGHTDDNIVIWFPKEKILYGGCFLKSTEAKDLGNLADANVFAWRNALKRLKVKFPHPNFVIVGHDSWKNQNSIKHTLKLVNTYLEKHPPNHD